MLKASKHVSNRATPLGLNEITGITTNAETKMLNIKVRTGKNPLKIRFKYTSAPESASRALIHILKEAPNMPKGLTNNKQDTVATISPMPARTIETLALPAATST